MLRSNDTLAIVSVWGGRVRRKGDCVDGKGGTGKRSASAKVQAAWDRSRRWSGGLSSSVGFFLV